MAKKNTPDTSTPMDVIGSEAQALAAGYDGLYHLFGARVENWEIVDDVLVARNFTVDGQYNPETIITDISRKNRRAPLWPTLNWILDPNFVPAPFENSLAVTTFMVQFFKGSTGENNSRSAEYVKAAAAAYKDRTGTRVRRGPKSKTIQLKNIRDFNADKLAAAGLSRDDLSYLAEMATTALANIPEEVPQEEATV